MAKQRKPAGGGNDGSSELVVFVGVGLVLFMLWYVFHERIASALLALRIAESWVIGFFTPALEEERAWMKFVPRSTVTAGQMVDVSSQVGSYIRWVTVPVMLALGVWLYRKSPTERFRKTYTVVTLPQAVGDEYPWMRISLTNDFANMDQDKGNWAIAKTERQFARIHKLRNASGAIDRERAEAVFVRQLGSVFLGISAMQPHARALFALFAARTNRDFKAADQLLMQLANSFADGAPDYTGVDELIEKYKRTASVVASFEQHAYERTILMTLLERCRGGEGGKDYLPPNWFLWLKGIDRDLWYALADVGRRTPHVESAGVFAHWLTEKSRQKKLEVPYVRHAVDGLIAEMAKFLNDDDSFDGIFEGDDLMDQQAVPAAGSIPSPAEADKAFASGQGKRLARPTGYLALYD